MNRFCILIEYVVFLNRIPAYPINTIIIILLNYLFVNSLVNIFTKNFYNPKLFFVSAKALSTSLNTLSQSSLRCSSIDILGFTLLFSE